MILSDKKIREGHRLRHAAVALLKQHNISCDLFGPSFTPLPNKFDGLAPYMFSIVIENSRTGSYMSEKLFDALAVGTVPIYWGNAPAFAEFADSVISWQQIYRTLFPR